MIRGTRSALSALAVVLAAPAAGAGAAAQSAADAAWDAGNHSAAESLYVARLAVEPNDDRALHRLGLLRAWSRRYDESLALFDRLLALSPDNVEAAVDRARVLAWRGQLSRALAALDEALASHPDYLPGLQARAEIAGWAGETQLAVAAYDRITAMTPEDRVARRDRAQALLRASRYGDARRAYDSLVATDPGDRDAVLGLARVLAWSGALDSATAVYEHVLREDPRNLEALRGVARSASWSGNLSSGEAGWRRALAVAPDDVEAHVGLGQTLRWQGRHADALEVLRRALELDPTNRDARTQLRWTETVIEPRLITTVTYEGDSDRNRVLTTWVRGAWRPRPRVQVSIDAYRRGTAVANAVTPDRSAVGLFANVWGQAGSGWAVSGGAGFSSSAAPGRATTAALSATVETPARWRRRGTLGVSRRRLDLTVPLIEAEVAMTELFVTGTERLDARSEVTGRLAVARYRGTETNRRLEVAGAFTRQLGAPWAVGAGLRVLGFRDDLNDGYFDPSFYALGEVTGRWDWNRGAVSGLVEVAPGVEHIAGAAVRGAVRASTRAGYVYSPGREVALRAVYATTRMQSAASGGRGYSYWAVSMVVGWLF